MMRAGKSKYLAVALAVCVAAFGGGPAVNAQSRTPRVIRIEPEPAESGAYLGIQMEDVTASNMATYKLNSERGVIIRTLEKGSPAEAAKLQPNDVLLEYSGLPVISAMQLSRLVRETPPDRTVDLVVSRDGKKMNLSVKLGKREGTSRAEGRNFSNLQRWFDFQGPGGRMFQFRAPEQSPGLLPARPGTEQKPRLGVSLQPLTDQMAEFLGVPGKGKMGVLVASVEPGTPAASKLKAGDVIIRADGRALENPDDLIRLVQRKDGGKLDLEVIRERKEISVTVDLAANSRGYKL